MRVRDIPLLFAIAVVLLFAGTPRVHAAGRSVSAENVWRQYDTGAYVVSTLNLLHTGAGHPLMSDWSRTVGVGRMDVYADATHAGLYYIDLERETGTSVAWFVYRLGWVVPEPLTPGLPGLAHARPSLQLRHDFRSDDRVLIGTFPVDTMTQRGIASRGTPQRDQIRFTFGGNDNDRLQNVSWDEWFKTFDDRKLVFLYQQKKSDGHQSNFIRFDSPFREDA